MLTLSVGSASCSEDEPIQGTGQQVTPGNGSGSGDNGSNNNGNNPDDNDDNNDDTPVSNNLKITIGPVSFMPHWTIMRQRKHLETTPYDSGYVRTAW